jgi:peptidoglycan/LPS O-acetylase OafA/YrhL
MELSKNLIGNLKTKYMNKKTILIIVAVLCLVAAFIMWSFRHDSHLSELGDFAWVPVPLGIICILLAAKSKK